MKDQLAIFKSLFKGRTDVFAIRWEKMGSPVIGLPMNCINDSLIESVRFEFIKRAFFKPKEGVLLIRPIHLIAC